MPQFCFFLSFHRFLFLDNVYVTRTIDTKHFRKKNFTKLLFTHQKGTTILVSTNYHAYIKLKSGEIKPGNLVKM